MATLLSKGITGEFSLGENYEVPGNTNWRLLNAYALDQWANDPTTTTALLYGYRGGMADDSTILIGGTIGLTDATTNYVERTSLGTVSKNTVGFTAGQIAMAKVVTVAGAITTLTDCRRVGTASLVSPLFTGVPQVPTAPFNTNTLQAASCAFVRANAISPIMAEAKGDLFTATAPEVVVRLAVGTNGKVLTADSTQATGLIWGAAGITASTIDAKGDLLAGTANDTVGRLAVGTNGFGLVADSAQTTGIKWQARDVALPIVIGDGINVIPTGLKLVLEIPFACTIIAARLVSNDGTSGSIVCDVWKDTYANAPPTGADTITASAKPTLSSAIKSEDITLTGWTTAITAGDWLGFNVDSASTVKLVTLSLTLRRS